MFNEKQQCKDIGTSAIEEYFKLKNRLRLTDEEIKKIPYKMKIRFDERETNEH